MLQGILRLSPLRWFDALLSYVTRPFARARNIRRYATNGYRLFGVVLLAAALPLWLLWGAQLGRLAVRLRGGLGFLLEPAGLREVPEAFVMLALPVLAYVLGYLIRPVRLYVGEKFADAFFRAAGAALDAGDWCFENRWASLFIIVLLVTFITWGTFYLFEQSRRSARPPAAVPAADSGP
ncbi:MAG TPA: hypothetical protein VJ866_17425 [Pyrinomonadaceae bacterium]|nr:hypothetical protein [Pyrinomonadaceae bacterium]